MATTTKKTSARKSNKKPAEKATSMFGSRVSTYSLSVPTTTSASSKTISREDRQRMIEQAAYFRAEKRNFQGDPNEDWMAAEADIDAQLERQGIKIV
jgi:hypothetical protein